MTNVTNGKNIVLCLDGTGDWGGHNKTNVMRIYRAATKNSTQVVAYFGGVGTLGDAAALSGYKRMFLKLLDLAVATGLTNQVLDAYRTIVEHYETGDRIFLFGFSRGAFAARLVAALVHKFGVLKKENVHLAPYLWQSISNVSDMIDFHLEATRIKGSFSKRPSVGGVTKGDHEAAEDVPIHFMGLFDTVSSVGIFERFKVFPHSDSNPAVQTARHAVSREESRNAFPEQLLNPAIDKHGEYRVKGEVNDILEVWFEGVHRDVGGGAPDGERALERMTLAWMIWEARACGLTFNPSMRKDKVPQAKVVHRGGFDPYVFVGLYPQFMFDFKLKRLSNPEEGRKFNEPKPGSRILWPVQAAMAWLGGNPLPPKPKPKEDSGFRYRWPNFKHPRVPPENAVFFTGDETHISYATADISEGFNSRRPRYRETATLDDFCGATLGPALAFLVGNALMGSPLGSSWIEPWGQITLYCFLIYLLFQGMYGGKSGGAAGQKALAIAGILALIAVNVGVFMNNPHLPLHVATGFGLLAGCLSQLPPSKPTLFGDRVIAYFMIPWAAIGLLLPAVRWIVPPVWSAIVGLGDWLVPEKLPDWMPTAGRILIVLGALLHLFQLLKKHKTVKGGVGPNAIVASLLWLAILGATFKWPEIQKGVMDAAVDSTENVRTICNRLKVEPFFTPIAWTLAVWAGVSGLMNIMLDRIKMTPKKAGRDGVQP